MTKRLDPETKCRRSGPRPSPAEILARDRAGLTGVVNPIIDGAAMDRLLRFFAYDPKRRIEHGIKEILVGGVDQPRLADAPRTRGAGRPASLLACELLRPTGQSPRSRAWHDGDAVPMPSGIDGLDPRQLARSGRRAGHPAELPRRRTGSANPRRRHENRSPHRQQ